MAQRGVGADRAAHIMVVRLRPPHPEDGAVHVRQRSQGDGGGAGGVVDPAGSYAVDLAGQLAVAVVAQPIPAALTAVVHDQIPRSRQRVHGLAVAVAAGGQADVRFVGMRHALDGGARGVGDAQQTIAGLRWNGHQQARRIVHRADGVSRRVGQIARAVIRHGAGALDVGADGARGGRAVQVDAIAPGAAYGLRPLGAGRDHHRHGAGCGGIRYGRLGLGTRNQRRENRIKLDRQIALHRLLGQFPGAVVFGGIGHGGIPQPRRGLIAGVRAARPGHRIDKSGRCRCRA